MVVLFEKFFDGAGRGRCASAGMGVAFAEGFFYKLVMLSQKAWQKSEKLR